MLELSGKDFKAAIIKMLQQVIIKPWKWKKTKPLESLNKRTEYMKKEQREVLEVNNAVNEI